jgi:putative redox protein
MDAPVEVGGSGAATRPIELFLMGLAGCTSMDVISLLNKKRVPFTDFKVQTTTEREDEHPKVFKSVNIHFQIFGNGIKEKEVARSIELSSEKYCAASAMLKKALPVTTSYEIIETK